VACFKILSGHLSGRTQEIRENPKIIGLRAKNLIWITKQ